MILTLAILVFAFIKVLEFEHHKNNLPRIRHAKSCEDCNPLKVKISDTQFKEIAGNIFYVKPVDTFYWKNKCRGTEGESIVYQLSDSIGGIAVKVCD